MSIPTKPSALPTLDAPEYFITGRTGDDRYGKIAYGALPGIDEAVEQAEQAKADAEVAAAQAALYDGPKVNVFGDLSGVTPAQLTEGALIRVIETGAVYERVASDGDLDYTGSGGVMLRRVRNPDARVTDYSDVQDMFLRGGGVIDVGASVPGVIETRPNTLVEGRPGEFLSMTQRSVVGAFVTGVTMNPALRGQEHIYFDRLNLTGEDYPDPWIVEVDSATTTTVTLTSAASPVDDFYKGYIAQVMSGVSGGNFWNATVQDYDGATRTLTFAAPQSEAPAAGAHIQIGYNENAMGFSWGTTHTRVTDGISKGFDSAKMTPPILGGKGLNFEQGAHDGVVRGRRFEGMTSGLYITGHPGTHVTGASKGVTGIRGSELHFEDCRSAVTLGVIDGVAGIPDDPSLLQAVLTNMTYHNCGHAPLRIVGGGQQKSGILNLMGAHGVNVAHVRGYNDATYVADKGGYPTDYPARVGYGLSGPIGAVIWGHARNTRITDWNHHGDADAAVHIGRVRALGDDAPGGSGIVSELFGWDIDGLSVFGTVYEIVSRDTQVGFNAANIRGQWRIAVNACTRLLDPGLSGGTAWTLDLTELSSGKRVIGTAAQILTRGNSFADYPAGTTDLRTQDRRVFVLPDDTAVSFTPLRNYGLMTITSLESLLQNHWRYRANVVPQCALFLTSSNSAATTGALTGTTGADGSFTVSAHTDGKVYLENRRGAEITVTVTMPTA